MGRSYQVEVYAQLQRGACDSAWRGAPRSFTAAAAPALGSGAGQRTVL
eukprot:COSAG06_NODE_61035_length_269_cov_0.594118_1_plen_47_part_10